MPEDTRWHVAITFPLRHTSMTHYQFLVSEREHGNFNEYMRRGLISSNLFLWLEVFEFHLDHPKASTWLIANKFGISQKHVRNIYAYMASGEKI
jgi:hypothetical protein